MVSELGGWDVVPPTVLRDGPLGPGSVQLWIGDPFDPVADDVVVDLVPEGRTPDGLARGLRRRDTGGSAVTVVHSGADDVRSPRRARRRRSTTPTARARTACATGDGPPLGHRPRRDVLADPEAAHRAVGLGRGAARRGRPRAPERLRDALADDEPRQRLARAAPGGRRRRPRRSGSAAPRAAACTPSQPRLALGPVAAAVTSRASAVRVVGPRRCPTRSRRVAATPG